MGKRVLAAVLVALLALTGCHVKKVSKLPVSSAPNLQAEQIVGATTLKGQDVSFDPPGATFARGKLTGTVNKGPYEIEVSELQRVWVQRTELSKGRTVGLVAAVAVGTVALVAGVIAATKQSCPFVYSWNGSEYVFDAEPYGGAISRGLEKDDYSELGQLRESDGTYRLKLTNEVDETQFTNMTELWVVDHPSGTRVVPDLQGKLHTVSAPSAPLSARDSQGHDLLPWLRSTDRLIWEPPAIADQNGSLEGDIIMSFPKPDGAKEVKLVANAATGLWGSYMIKRMVELRGRDVSSWYREVDENKSAREALTAWEVREQLYALRIYVEEPTGWQMRGVLPGTGPFISKDRIVPLDVSRVKGDQLRIRIHPPAGFWALNSFAVDYSVDRPIQVQTLSPSWAKDASSGRDVLPQLAGVDDRYLPMPNIGDTADIVFRAPQHRPGEDRAVFLHTRGYYKLHVSGKGDPDMKTLDAIENQHGFAVHLAAERFKEWQLAKR